MNITGTKSL